MPGVTPDRDPSLIGAYIAFGLTVLLALGIILWDWFKPPRDPDDPDD